MKSDTELLEKYSREKPWGISTSIDLYKCNPGIIRDAEEIKRFVGELCDLIEVQPFGEPRVVDFGDDSRVSGFSMTQLIETSLLSGHFANQSNAVYLDIFSCKEYPPQKVADFCKRFFRAKDIKVTVTFRY